MTLKTPGHAALDTQPALQMLSVQAFVVAGISIPAVEPALW